jgi:hypothetical protein
MVVMMEAMGVVKRGGRTKAGAEGVVSGRRKKEGERARRVRVCRSCVKQMG